MLKTCERCEERYPLISRKNKPGRITICNDCAEEEGDIQVYTGCQIYSHKTGSSIQINTDPKLTAYIINSTKLQNKGSNLGNNIIESSKMKNKNTGGCLVTADSFSYKNRDV